MSGDIETLLRETARTARPSGLPATPSDLRRQGDRRRALRRGGTAVVAVTLVGGIAVGLSGLPGASSTSPIGSGTSGATSATESLPPSTFPASQASVPAAVSHTAVAPVTASRPCAGSDLRVSETGDVAAAGSAQAVLVFRNVGTVACWLRGYPTVLAEGTNPSSVLRATPALTANLGGGSAVVSTIPIAPGQAGSATLQWGDNPAGDVTTCLSSPVFAVTPPGTSTVTRLQSPAYVGVCFAPEVLPVVAGTQGTVPAP